MSKAIKPIVLNPNESIEVKFPKHGKLLAKKVGKDILIFEEGSETPLAVYENVDTVASTIDLSSLPHFAEASNGVMSDATAPATTETQKEEDNDRVPAWWYVAGGTVAIGGVALASSGGSSSSAPIVTPPASDTTAPTITSGATATALNENSGAGQVIYTATATDSSPLTYSLKSGSDTGVSINTTTGVVTLTANPDFETKSNYSFTVVATDNGGNISEQAVTFAVTNVDDTAPAFTSSSTATTAENVTTSTVVYDATADNDVGVTYAISGTDEALFDLNSTTGAVTFKTSPDFEAPSDNGANNIYDFTIRATDSAGNTTDQNVALTVTDVVDDTIAPTLLISDNVSATTATGTITYTFQFSEAISGFDVSDIVFTNTEFHTPANMDTSISAGALTQIDADTYTYTLTPDGGTGSLRVDVRTGSFTDTVGNVNTANTTAVDQQYSVIDMGTDGKLILGVEVDNNWYYYWDRSGDGTSANTGSLNGGVDYMTHDVLDGLFNHDINGVANTTIANPDGAFGTTNDYHYGELNGIQLALPTTGTGNASETISYGLNDNQSYTDLAEIWDSFNTGYQTNGTPSGWQGYHYWSATPTTDGHAKVGTSFGSINRPYDYENDDYVALQVL